MRYETSGENIKDIKRDVYYCIAPAMKVLLCEEDWHKYIYPFLEGVHNIYSYSDHNGPPEHYPCLVQTVAKVNVDPKNDWTGVTIHRFYYGNEIQKELERIKKETKEAAKCLI